MRPETKGYILKEYGSWSVLLISFLCGIAASRAFDVLLLPLFLSLALLINSKQAFTRWTRGRGGLSVFLGQLAAAAAVLLFLFGGDIPMLLPLLLFPAAYLLLNRFAGEHNLLTEASGFALISLAAVLAKFLLTGGIDVRLFVAVALYFIAGVFKVRVLLRKKAVDRVLSVAYVMFCLFIYKRFYIPSLVLLPLLDNVAASVLLYSVRLRTTGWIEVGKSLLFLVLLSVYYS